MYIIYILICRTRLYDLYVDKNVHTIDCQAFILLQVFRTSHAVFITCFLAPWIVLALQALHPRLPFAAEIICLSAADRIKSLPSIHHPIPSNSKQTDCNKQTRCPFQKASYWPGNTKVTGLTWFFSEKSFTGQGSNFEMWSISNSGETACSDHDCNGLELWQLWNYSFLCYKYAECNEKYWPPKFLCEKDMTHL